MPGCSNKPTNMTDDKMQAATSILGPSTDRLNKCRVSDIMRELIVMLG